MLYIHRELEKSLHESLKEFSVLGFTGPRCAGKTTFLKRVLKDYTYVCFDNFKIIAEFAKNPHQFIAACDHKVIFDDAEKVPGLLKCLNEMSKKKAYSTRKYVLVSSTYESLLKGVTDISPKVGFLTLLPFQCKELPKTFREKAIFCGSYPELINKKYQIANEWFSSYLETYLNADISLLGQVSDMNAFRRLMQMLAADICQPLNLSIYAEKLKVEVKTIKRWISLMQASYMVFLLPPYNKNYGKRIIKSPKIYFYDTGLVTFLTGKEFKVDFEKNPLADQFFENYIVIETLKKQLHYNTGAELFYLRTNHGAEISLIVKKKKHKELILIENADIFHYKKLRMLESYMDSHDKGYFLYRGERFPSTKVEIMDYRDYLLN